MKDLSGKRITWVSLLVLGWLMLPCLAEAKKPANTPPAGGTNDSYYRGDSEGNKVLPKHYKEPWLKVAISQTESEIIRNYYSRQGYEEWRHRGKHGKKQKRLPPGLRKKLERGGSLPPGWQKKVERGEVLDEDIYYHCERLPNDLLRRLPPPPPGTIIFMLEGKAVRLYEATRTIIDVLDLKF